MAGFEDKLLKLCIQKPLNLQRSRFLKWDRLKNNFLDLAEFINLWN